MKLIEALNLLKQPVPEDLPLHRVFLACGYTPLHLQTLLLAYLRKLLPQQRVEVQTGLFGDLAGNVERLEGPRYDMLVVVIEWQDLDARLGIRRLGGWRATDLPDILNSAERAIGRLKEALRLASESVPICVCMPTLPLPPLFTSATWQASHDELNLRGLVAALAASLAGEQRIRVLSAQRLDIASPPHARFDAKAELTTGFPYRLPHASALAGLLAELMQNVTRMKGLITDLDDTLWLGILGEVGTEGISWNLPHTQMHGLYQQFLGSLASAGVLIGVASKNERVLVEEAFEREDLVLSKETVYPIEAGWDRKSESVRSILKKWNIGPDAVVFIDDSPMEVAEVKAAFPEMECILFPKDDHQAIWDLLMRLRDMFGKSTIFQEDSIRLQSIRAQAASAESSGIEGKSLDDFLQSVNAVVRFTLGKQPEDTRSFELINKTNQFNLNGNRLTSSHWINYLNDPKSFLLTVGYDDKFGPLGKIAVLMGRVHGKQLAIDVWVMSCRAFSRRIEHHCLRYLFEKFAADEIVFDFQPTPRNAPLQEFFRGFLDAQPEPGLRLSRSCFLEKTPSLFHQVKESS